MMEKLMFHQLIDKEYIGVVTVLDYEIRVNKYLSELSFSSIDNSKRKVIVDLALKSGMDQYRFVAFDVDDSGKIVLSSNEFIKADAEILYLANDFLKERKEIVRNSILPETKKEEILSMCS